ncbi:N-acetylglucosamine-specific PTS transporter subunit IIBC, partial [Caulobacter sp. 17J65-9]|uniref:N-acetylglucosamine-specific PTS transporter subunit IIBC n=1 Tax=Caulobacter sp. 17J65-9 TaxID=2709382 RepID=UPI0013C86C3A
MKSPLAGLQKLGRALMLPIAVLPVAGLLLRLGQPDLLNIAFISAAGQAIFSNLGLLFAIGVAVGFARENHGAAGLAGAVGYLVATQGAKVLIAVPPEVTADVADKFRGLAEAAFKDGAVGKLSVPIGLLSGLIAGGLYNRYGEIKLPDYLAFFGGRRFVPIASGFAGLLLAAAFGFGWPYVEHGMDELSRTVLESGEIGLFGYGVLNRALLVTGLHHIINNLAWFVLGDYHGATGDLGRFFAGDPSAGAFMTGFFPVMMFGLPAACLAMYHAARPERRKAVGGMLLSMALTSFLTGVTEPIEFTFMFLAPLLYAIHALLTGLSMVIMDLLNVRLGFSFSAGAFDYVLSFGKGTNGWLLIPVGLAYAAAYYGLFRLCIAVFKLQTPGRELDEAVAAEAPVPTGTRGEQFVRALGGAANLTSIDACTTRLRLEVVDQSAVNAGALKDLGARGLVKPSATALQIVLGPIADQVAGEIRAAAARGGQASKPAATAAPIAPAASPKR